MIQSIVRFVSFLKSIERKILLQKWLPYSDRLGVKKNLFSYALQTLALKYKNFYALLSTYLGGALKKLAKQVEKSAAKPRFSGPFYTFPILFQTHSISSGNENKNIWCRDFHEIRASYSNSTYLNPVRVWVGPKTKYMVSWLLGKFVPESKPFFLFLHGMHTCMFALKKIFIHILRFVECNVTAVLNGGNCYTLL